MEGRIQGKSKGLMETEKKNRPEAATRRRRVRRRFPIPAICTRTAFFLFAAAAAAEEGAPPAVRISEGAAEFWRDAMEAYADEAYEDAQRLLGLFERAEKTSGTNTSPALPLARFFALSSLDRLGRYEDLAMRLGDLDPDAVPDPYHHEMEVLALKANLPAAARGRRLTVPPPPPPAALAPLADARHAAARGEVLAALGETEEDLAAIARAIVHAAPEDARLAAAAAREMIRLLEVSGYGEEATRMREVMNTLHPPEKGSVL